jgi:glycosyltransferase involved in cell wall biosynthesis
MPARFSSLQDEPMTPRSAKVSVGLPVYNGEKFLPEVLENFLSQTFADIEIVICDNASTDGTQQICRAYAARDTRVRYFRNEKNLGAIANFNRVFELARAPLFKWAAHDDLYRETYLESCVRILDENPDVVLAHSGTAFIDEKGATFPFDLVTSSFVDPKTGVHQTPDSPTIGDSPQALVRFWQVLRRARWGSHMFGLMRRDVLSQTKLMPNFAGGDRAMLAELALLGRFQSTREVLYLKRFHEQVSWALSQKELKSFLSTDGKAYSRRARQLGAFFSTPHGKPIGIFAKAACVVMVAVHSAKVALQALRQKEARNAAQGCVWRDKSTIPT